MIYSHLILKRYLLEWLFRLEKYHTTCQKTKYHSDDNIIFGYPKRICWWELPAIAACQFEQKSQAIMGYSDIIKIDFPNESIAIIELDVKKFRQYRTKLLAGKVETEEEFEAALCADFGYFQGNLFSKTEIILGYRWLTELHSFV